MSVPSIGNPTASPQPPATPMKKGRFSRGLPRSPEGKGVQSLLAKASLGLRAKEEELKPKKRLFDSPSASNKRTRDLEAADEDLDFPPGESPALASPLESPMKRSRVGSETPSIFTQVRHFANSGKMGVFHAKGSYMDVYKSNEKEVTKVLNAEISSNPKKAESYMRTILENYKKAVALGIPVAKILNDPLKDGCIKQEYIPEAINPSDPNQYEQIRNFFFCAMKNNISLDLSPSNLRVENGKVILVDFVEEEDEEMEGAKMFTLDSVAKWAVFYAEEAKRNGLAPEAIKNSTTAFINSLTEGFEKYLFDDVASFNLWKEGIVSRASPSPVIFG